MSYEKYNWEVGDTLTSNRLNNIQEGIDNMSSSYQKTIWVDGDIITAEKLNNIENGIKNIDIANDEDEFIDTFKDDKTRLFIHFPEDTPKFNRAFYFQQPLCAQDSTISIDWGDNSVEEFTSNIPNYHDYNLTGDYIITLTILHGSINYLRCSDYCASALKNIIVGPNVINTSVSNCINLKHAIFYNIDNTDFFNKAFSNCKNLSTIDFSGSTFTEMPPISSGGNGCENLKKVILPNTLTSIGSQAFTHCHSLTNIVIPDSVTSIGESAFAYCYALTNIVIPDNVTSIGSQAFSHCYSLTNIVIPDSVTSIGSYTFALCYSLLNVSISNNITTIPLGCFQDCKNLKNVTLFNNITKIEQWGFQGCIDLNKIILYGDIPELGENAFPSDTNLTECHLLSNTSLDFSKFELLFPNLPPIFTIYVPENLVDTYKSATGWSTYADKIQAEPTA